MHWVDANGNAKEQTPANVMYRHHNSKTVPGGRMGSSDRMEQLTPRGSPEARVRGVEDQGIQNGGPGGTSTMRDSKNKRGNRIRGVNPNRTDRRARRFNAAGAAEANAGNMSNMPALRQHDPNNPTANQAACASNT